MFMGKGGGAVTLALLFEAGQWAEAGSIALARIQKPA